jgi:hypothetical protein
MMLDARFRLLPSPLSPPTARACHMQLFSRSLHHFTAHTSHTRLSLLSRSALSCLRRISCLHFASPTFLHTALCRVSIPQSIVYLDRRTGRLVLRPLALNALRMRRRGTTHDVRDDPPRDDLAVLHGPTHQRCLISATVHIRATQAEFPIPRHLDASTPRQIVKPHRNDLNH